MTDVKDTVSGIALLYGADDDYSVRLIQAMETDDLEEMEHVSALMVCALYSRDKESAQFCSERWGEAFLK